MSYKYTNIHTYKNTNIHTNILIYILIYKTKQTRAKQGPAVQTPLLLSHPLPYMALRCRQAHEEFLKQRDTGKKSSLKIT